MGEVFSLQCVVLQQLLIEPNTLSKGCQCNIFIHCVAGSILRIRTANGSKQQLGSIHAADENLDIAAIAEAAAFYKYFVENFQ